MPQTRSKPTNVAAFEAVWKRFHDDNCRVDEVPPGWISSTSYAKLNGVTRDSASGMLRRMLSRGLVEVKKFRVARGPVGIRTETYFKLK